MRIVQTQGCKILMQILSYHLDFKNPRMVFNTMMTWGVSVENIHYDLCLNIIRTNWLIFTTNLIQYFVGNEESLVLDGEKK